jgi:hypothetical protein
MSWSVLFLFLSVVLFALATFSVPSPPRFSLVPAGLMCAALSLLISSGVLPPN